MTIRSGWEQERFSARERIGIQRETGFKFSIGRKREILVSIECVCTARAESAARGGQSICIGNARSVRERERENPRD